MIYLIWIFLPVILFGAVFYFIGKKRRNEAEENKGRNPNQPHPNYVRPQPIHNTNLAVKTAGVHYIKFLFNSSNNEFVVPREVASYSVEKVLNGSIVYVDAENLEWDITNKFVTVKSLKAGETYKFRICVTYVQYKDNTVTNQPFVSASYWIEAKTLPSSNPSSPKKPSVSEPPKEKPEIIEKNIVINLDDTNNKKK